MTYAEDALALLAEAAHEAPVPRVRALHLPPPPEPGRTRGEFGALELTDRTLGLAFVLLGDTWVRLREAVPTMTIAGADPLDLARRYVDGDSLERTVGLAAVNALTRCVFDRAGFAPPTSSDSLGLLDPAPGEAVGMIGYFAPLVPQLVARGAQLVVVELRADLVGERDSVRVTLDPAELGGCAQVLATGTLLLNDTLDGMLQHCRHARRLALVGPTVGGPPDPLFARGVTVLGGRWVIDSRGYVDALQRGAPTCAFARKFSLAAADYPGWRALRGSRSARG
jgi:uncharacterized protein (DUF4213/DUF364 family)